ncbi:MAG: alpha/beta fold hydrolase [Pseudomonadota bacterium]
MVTTGIRRGFVDLDEGQFHYRELGSGDGTPLVMLHQASGSSRTMAPMMPAVARNRRVIAIDLPGNGDSCPPVAEDPTMVDYADAIARAVHTLGLQRFAVYGFHAGASVAAELAIARPDAVAALVLDSVGLYEPEEAERLANDYMPPVERHPHGLHLIQLWHYVRDTYLFWPWHQTDAAHARAVGLPPLPELHDKTVEVIKGMDHFAKLYRAAFLHDKATRLPMITTPTLVTVGRTNSQRDKLDTVAALISGAETLVTDGIYTPGDADATARQYAAWLRSKTDQ